MGLVVEWSRSLFADVSFRCRKMLKLCGETQDKLAQELIMFELTIERDVVEPLNDLSEVRRSGGSRRVTDG